MSGYTGNPDAKAEHAAIISENGVAACQSMLRGTQLTHCRDCREKIPEARVALAKSHGHKCEYCIECQKIVDKKPKQRIRMLDRIL